MAKKYLLYIHDELFEDEPKKSELVNNLLERHYHDTVDGGKSQEQVHAEIREAQKALSEVPVPTQDRYGHTLEGPFGPVSLPMERDNSEMCEHGQGVRLCRDKKCKNYQFKR